MNSRNIFEIPAGNSNIKSPTRSMIISFGSVTYLAVEAPGKDGFVSVGKASRRRMVAPL